MVRCCTWWLLLALIGHAHVIGLAGDEVKAPGWPQFRGPHRDDVSTEKGLLHSWPQEGPPLVWKATGLGEGFSSVAIADGKIFTLGNKDGKTYVRALDLPRGKLLWSAPVGTAGSNLGSTPTVDGDRLYAIGQEGDLVCVKIADGAVIWHKNFIKDFGGEAGSWRFTESPLVDGSALICTPGAKDACMAAFDKKTGEVLWKCASPFEDPTAGYSSIVVAPVGSIRVYVQLTAGGVVGVDAKSGKLQWHYDKLGNNTANIPTPIVLGNLVFCSAGYGKGGALLEQAVQGDGVKITERYFKPELNNKHGGLLVVGDHVYGDRDDSGMPFCAEFKTGKVVWRRQSRGQGRGSAAVTYADGHLYFRYDNGVMALVPATPDGYQETGTFKIPNADSQSWAHPVVAGGKLYLREQDILWCYNVKETP
jgi:outer membrane protein assembly factor BamB